MELFFFSSEIQDLLDVAIDELTRDEVEESQREITKTNGSIHIRLQLDKQKNNLTIVGNTAAASELDAPFLRFHYDVNNDTTDYTSSTLGAEIFPQINRLRNYFQLTQEKVIV